MASLFGFLKSNAFEVFKPTPSESSQGVYQGVFYHGGRSKKVIALTFDADMTFGMLKKLNRGEVGSYYNKKVIDILEEDNIPATLFITGLWAQRYPDITKELFNNPLFEIGNHSYSHPAFTAFCFDLPPVGNREDEFKKSQEILKNIIGVYPKLFRFPGGCFEKSDLELATKYGLNVIGWDVDGRDAFNSDPAIIVQAIKREVKPGSIVVMHMQGGKAPMTAVALPEVISFLKKQGYTFVKVSDLLIDK